MKLSVHNHYTETNHTIEGSQAAVTSELIRLYPWLADGSHTPPLADLIEHLESSQAYEVDVEGGDPSLSKSESNLNDMGREMQMAHDMLGYNPHMNSAFEAAAWMTGGRRIDIEAARQALWEADGDPEQAALIGHGLEASAENIEALRAIQAMGKMAKAEEASQAKSVEPAMPDATEAAHDIKSAFRDSFVFPIKLGGKHSLGSMLARNEESRVTWLLKPGSGGNSPAAGIGEEIASQSRREVAYYHMAEAWGLGDYLPECQLVVIDGREYAAIRLLPWSYKPVDLLKREHPAQPEHLFADYVKHGTAHRWAALDAILGNSDRHANNIMADDDGKIALIDHGSSMAGRDFNPSTDRYTFTPYYLRAKIHGKWSTMSPEAKLKAMPRLDAATAADLKAWLFNLRPEDLDRVLLRYGVNSEPAKARLAHLQQAAQQAPADEVINRFWV